MVRTILRGDDDAHVVIGLKYVAAHLAKADPPLSLAALLESRAPVHLLKNIPHRGERQRKADEDSLSQRLLHTYAHILVLIGQC